MAVANGWTSGSIAPSIANGFTGAGWSGNSAPAAAAPASSNPTTGGTASSNPFGNAGGIAAILQALFGSGAGGSGGSGSPAPAAPYDPYAGMGISQSNGYTYYPQYRGAGVDPNSFPSGSVQPNLTPEQAYASALEAKAQSTSDVRDIYNDLTSTSAGSLNLLYRIGQLQQMGKIQGTPGVGFMNLIGPAELKPDAYTTEMTARYNLMMSVLQDKNNNLPKVSAAAAGSTIMPPAPVFPQVMNNYGTQSYSSGWVGGGSGGGYGGGYGGGGYAGGNPTSALMIAGG